MVEKRLQNGPLEGPGGLAAMLHRIGPPNWGTGPEPDQNRIRAGPGRAGPSQAEPSRAEPSRMDSEGF